MTVLPACANNSSSQRDVSINDKTILSFSTCINMVDLGFMKLPLSTSVGAVPAALTGFAVGSLALFPGLPTAPFYTFAHFKSHTKKHKSA